MADWQANNPGVVMSMGMPQRPSGRDPQSNYSEAPALPLPAARFRQTGGIHG